MTCSYSALPMDLCTLRTNTNHHILSNLGRSTFVPMVAFGVALSSFGRISCCLPTRRKKFAKTRSAGRYTPVDAPDQEVISAWRDSAPFWEKHREIIRQMFAPVTQFAISCRVWADCQWARSTGYCYGSGQKFRSSPLPEAAV